MNFLFANDNLQLFANCHLQIKNYCERKELVVKNNKNVELNNKKEMEHILALALVKNLYNQGKISEFVFNNIRRDTEKKISLENREYIC